MTNQYQTSITMEISIPVIATFDGDELRSVEPDDLDTTKAVRDHFAKHQEEIKNIVWAIYNDHANTENAQAKLDAATTEDVAWAILRSGFPEMLRRKAE